MVSQKQLQKNSWFLKALRDSKNVNQLRTILNSAAQSCLRVLVLLIKACVLKKIPLDLNDIERRKLARYKSVLRHISDLGFKSSR